MDNLPQRISPRRSDYDYTSTGGYFITICVAGKQHYFGEIINGEMILNDLGNIVNQYIQSIPEHFPHIEIHEHIVMPNHLHLLLIMSELHDDRRDANTARPQYNQSKYVVCPPSNNESENNNGIMQRTARDAVPTNKPLPMGPQYGSLGYIINQLKSTCTREINKQSTEGKIQIPYGDIFARQPRYHDHIIRNEKEYDQIKYYIQTNPQNRADDTFNK